MEREHAVDSSPLQKQQSVRLVTATADHDIKARRADRPGAVCPAGDQSVDEQLVTVTGSNVERSVSILIHTVNLPTCHEGVQSKPHKNLLSRKKEKRMRLTVLNEGLRASEASMNCCHVKRTLPITALNNTKSFFRFIRAGLSSYASVKFTQLF